MEYNDDKIENVIHSLNISKDEKIVLSNLNYVHYATQNIWSVKSGDTKYVMVSLGLSRKKADELIEKVLNKLEQEKFIINEV